MIYTPELPRLTDWELCLPDAKCTISGSGSNPGAEGNSLNDRRCGAPALITNVSLGVPGPQYCLSHIKIHLWELAMACYERDIENDKLAHTIDRTNHARYQLRDEMERQSLLSQAP